MAHNLLLFIAFFTYAVLTGGKWKDTKHYFISFVIVFIILFIITRCTDNNIIKMCFPERNKGIVLILFVAGILGIFVGAKLKKQDFEFIPKDLKIDTDKLIPWK